MSSAELKLMKICGPKMWGDLAHPSTVAWMPFLRWESFPTYQRNMNHKWFRVYLDNPSLHQRSSIIVSHSPCNQAIYVSEGYEKMYTRLRTATWLITPAGAMRLCLLICQDLQPKSDFDQLQDAYNVYKSVYLLIFMHACMHGWIDGWMNVHLYAYMYMKMYKDILYSTDQF